MLMEQQWKQLYPFCYEKTVQDWAVIENFQVKFDASGVPIAGAWFDEATLAGCSQTHRLSVFTAILDGTLKRISTLPGTTYADLILQHDAVPAALHVASEYFPDRCNPGWDSVAVVDTHFLGFTGPPYPGAAPGHGRPWREEWIVRACSAQIAVTMSFVMDAGGTHYTAEKARLIPPEP